MHCAVLGLQGRGVSHRTQSWNPRCSASLSLFELMCARASQHPQLMAVGCRSLLILWPCRVCTSLSLLCRLRDQLAHTGPASCCVALPVPPCAKVPRCCSSFGPTRVCVCAVLTLLRWLTDHPWPARLGSGAASLPCPARAQTLLQGNRNRKEQSSAPRLAVLQPDDQPRHDATRVVLPQARARKACTASTPQVQNGLPTHATQASPATRHHSFCRAPGAKPYVALPRHRPHPPTAARET